MQTSCIVLGKKQSGHYVTMTAKWIKFYTVQQHYTTIEINTYLVPKMYKQYNFK